MRIAQNDEEALAEFYEQTRSQVHSLAFRIVGCRADAEEVMLDAYRKLWRLAPTFEPERGSAFGWLLLMTRHLAIDRVRQSAPPARAGLELDRLPSLLPNQEA